MNPSPVVVSGGDVDATFTVITKEAGKAELQIKPPGTGTWTSLDLKSDPHGSETKWTATREFDTKSKDGRWSVQAIAHGEGGASDSKSSSFVVKQVLDTRIVDFNASPDLVSKGDTIQTSGRLQIDRGGWTGYRGESVTITFREQGTDAYRHVTTDRTGHNGWFRASVKAEATGWWRAEFGGGGGAKGSVSDTDRVDIRHRSNDTRIVGFDAGPEPAERGDRLTLRGELQIDGRRGWDGYGGQRVSLLFKAHGSSRWEHVDSDHTDSDGRFRESVTASRSGWWKAEYEGRDGVRGSTSGTDYVRVSDPTPPPTPDRADSRITKFNAYYEPAKRGKTLRFKGKLQVDEGWSWDGHRAKVRLYFKPAGSGKWYWVKSTWSTGSGKIYTKTTAKRSGTWKLVFKGDEDAYGSSSKSDYVRVKR
ncbi:hypothetical protein [Streptosporangium sp. KLBMP 9127]|nr:hypothetical protein [Streptosporangium sp. KLBMP 9127]